MATQSLANGAAQAIGSNVANAALATPQGQAAVATTAAVVVATLPVTLPLALVGGIGFGLWKVAQWLDS